MITSTSVHSLPAPVEISNIIREFWSDTNRWIVAFIRSILFGTPDREAIKKRLLSSAVDYSSLLGRYYGEDVVGRLSANYLRYIRNLETLIEAYRDNNIDLIEQQRNILYGIGDELVNIFLGLNIYWDRTILQAMIYQIINSTEQQIVDIISGDYQKWIEDNDLFMRQVYRFSDEITYGILRQFPVSSSDV